MQTTHPAKKSIFISTHKCAKCPTYINIEPMPRMRSIKSATQQAAGYLTINQNENTLPPNSLAQQAQDALRHGVRLCQHGLRCLKKNVILRKSRNFIRHIRITNPALCGCDIL